MRHHRSRSGQRLAVALLALALVLAGVIARLASEPVGRVVLRPLLSSSVVLSGKPLALQWPSEGESAVEVTGLGSLGSRGSGKPVAIASVAKVMTAYLTLREHPLGGSGFTLRITPADVAREREDVARDESVVPVAAGEQLTERQALQALLLPSANNIAELLAIEDAGSVARFLTEMNATARSLGMAHTRYTDPSGFTPSTVSTAADQLKLAGVVMGEPGFEELVSEREATLPLLGPTANLNALVGEEGYVGIKTGSDTAAGGCLMFAKQIALAGHHLTVLGVVLGQRAGSYVPAALYSARRLGNSAAKAVAVRTVIGAGAAVLDARSASGERTTAVASRPLQVLGWPGMRVSLAVSRVRPNSTIRAGQVLGRIRLRGPVIAVGAGAGAPLKARAALGSPSLGWRLGHLF